MPNPISNQAESQAQAATIRRYWRERGHMVDVRVEPLHLGEKAALDESGEPMYTGYIVRSDMVNGWPKGVLSHAS